MNDMEMLAVQMITFVGTARSCYLEAIHAAKKGDMEKAEALMQEGKENFTQGHHAHADILTKEADGEPVAFSMILMHAEDQLMSAEGFRMIAEEFIDVYRKMAG